MQNSDPSKLDLKFDSKLKGLDSPKFNSRIWEHFSNEQYVEDIAVEFLYKPRSLTLLTITFLGLMYMAFEFESNDSRENLEMGLVTSIIVFLLFSLLALPSGPFQRPHPAIWRLVLGISLIYWFSCIFVLFQTPDDIRNYLELLFPGQTMKPDTTDYAADCRFEWKTIRSRIDIFVLGHFIGWIVKAMLLRNVWLCWTISILWEITEFLFINMLPNFAECWWDSLLLDIIICNGGGIYIGLKICEYLELSVYPYRWQSVLDISSPIGKLKRVLLQFTPSSWTKVNWDPTASFKRFVSIYLLVIVILIMELNTFFLKHIFFVPTNNILVLTRLGFWILVGAPALRQFYIYVTDSTCKRLGTQCWVATAIILTELIICIKHGRGQFPTSSPASTTILFSITVFFGTFVPIILYYALIKTSPPSPMLENKLNNEIFNYIQNNQKKKV